MSTVYQYHFSTPCKNQTNFAQITNCGNQVRHSILLKSLSLLWLKCVSESNLANTFQFYHQYKTNLNRNKTNWESGGEFTYPEHLALPLSVFGSLVMIGFFQQLQNKSFQFQDIQWIEKATWNSSWSCRLERSFLGRSPWGISVNWKDISLDSHLCHIST